MTATPNGWLTDPARLGQINAVAALVHWAPYNADAASDWGVDLTGDCQGKAAYAAYCLLTCGWFPMAMEYWACDLPDGRRHAVLQINIADMDGNVTPLIVDCRYPNPQVKDALNYSDWCKVE